MPVDHAISDPRKDTTGLPVLSPGRHLTSDDGACFMEFASVLAGEPWSDRPHCTHPALAELARAVNDACAPPDRQALVLLVPDVVGLTPTDARVTPALVRLCVRAARAAGPGPVSRRLDRAERAATRRLDAVSMTPLASRLVRLTEPVYRRGPARHAINDAIAHLRHQSPRSGAGVVDLLRTAIRICTELQGRRGAITPEPVTQPGVGAEQQLAPPHAESPVS